METEWVEENVTTTMPRSLQERTCIINGRRRTKDLGSLLAGHDLAVDDWLILGSLQETDGLTMSQLAEATVTSPASLCRFVDKLTDEALLYRRPNPFDRRQLRVFISQRGADLLKRINAELNTQEIMSD